MIIISHLYVNLDLGREKPKIEDIDNHVVPKWVSKWRQLGRQLNISQHFMDNIECNYPTDCESCCSDMFSERLTRYSHQNKYSVEV